MALSSFVGSFNARSGTGSQAVTGVGFLPKAVIFWSNWIASGSYSDTNGIGFMFGAADGTNSRSLCGGVVDNSGGSAFSRFDNGNCFCVQRFNPTFGTSSLFAQASLTSLDADGFTLNWGVNADGGGQTIFFMALAGSDLSVKVGSGWYTSTGDKAFTGVGFKPSGLITFATLTANGNDTTVVNGDARIGVGFVDTALNQGLSVYNCTIGGPAPGGYAQLSTECVGFGDSGAGIIDSHIVSLDSDGFTFHVDTSAQTVFGYVAIGGSVACTTGTSLQPTSNGSQAVTTSATNPGALLLSSVNAVHSTTGHNAIARYSFGGADASHVGGTWTAWNSNGGTSIAASRESTSKILTFGLENATGSSSTTNAEASLTSLDATGYTLNWTTTDATQRESLYFLLSLANTGTGTVAIVPVISGSGSISNPGSGAIALPFAISGVGDVKVHALNTQDLLEAVTLERVNVRTTQDVLEAISLSRVPSRVTQDLLEPVTITRVPLRVTQDLMEVVVLSKPRVIVYRTPKWELHRFDTKTRPEEEF